MYIYPINNINDFLNILETKPEDHTMGNSLERYLDIKIPSALKQNDFNRIVVRSVFDRTEGISTGEKNDKLFNYMRPTVFMKDMTAYVNCFPGFDYVFHYANIMKTYFGIKNINVPIEISLPTEIQCCDELINSGLCEIPTVDTVIMGYVESLQFLSSESNWKGEKNFLWKSVQTNHCKAILLGCKHTYWGEIAGKIVMQLAKMGVKKVIYSGKLGTLSSDIKPNYMLATGNRSILPNGQEVTWKNIFTSVTDSRVFSGVHITVPSVLQETKSWLSLHQGKAIYVDPEIGHMANAANQCGIAYSYLHIVSDNLSKKFASDLSNERKKEVISERRHLTQIIGKYILQCLAE